MADYSKMVKSIQKIVSNYLQSVALTDYCVGTVIAVQPLKIQINERIILEEASGQIILTEAVLQKELDLTHLHRITDSTEEASAHVHDLALDSEHGLTTKITVTEGLQVGDKVHLLRATKGQRYVVLSKIRTQQTVVIDSENQWKWS